MNPERNILLYKAHGIDFTQLPTFGDVTGPEEINAVRQHNSVFHSILKLLPWDEFHRAIERHEAKDRARGFSHRSHLVAMLYAQLAAIAPTVGALVGQAVAVGEAQSPAQGLALLAQMEDASIAGYQPWWVAKGYLLAQQGDYASVGKDLITLVDSDSFWVTGYFDETALSKISVGAPAGVKLMGSSDTIQGHVDSFAHGIAVANVQPNSIGLPSVNPIFAWVRLAQRVPVRIHLDQVPKATKLFIGQTATVEVHRPEK